MLETLRRMPGGVRLFLLYGFLVLAGIGVAFPYIVALAVGAPLSFPGLVVMILLAYTIFTMTLVLGRRQAGRTLALGLASLTVPTALLLLASRLLIEALFVGAFAWLLFRGLLRAEVRAWLNEP